MASELNPEERLRIELALRRLNADFCYYLDHRETDRLVDLFTADARYSHGERLSEGRDAIAALFGKRNSSGTRTARHLQSGLRIDVKDRISATGNSVCATFAADELPPVPNASPHLVADFEDEYEYCDDGRWRISQRHIERIFLHPGNEGPIGAG